MQEELLENMRSAVSKAVAGGRIGIAFSGGVDSTLVARICSDMDYDATLLTVGFAGSHDVMFAGKINSVLGLAHHTLEIDGGTFASVASEVGQKIRTENLSWHENCIAFYYVSKLARRLDIDAVITANGIDELFCGYDAYRGAYPGGQDEILRMMDAKLENESAMMEAVNLVASGFGVEIRQPLLSEQFIRFAKSIPISEKIHGTDDLLRKHAIRDLARAVGVPELSYAKRKKALQYGSKIHKMLLKSR